MESLPLPARNNSCVLGKGEFTRLSLSDLVMEGILTFEPVSYQEEEALEYKIEDSVMMAGNPSRTGQLIKTLIDNTVKYSVPRERAEVRLESVGRNRTRLWVCNQGEPIPGDKRTLVFRGFYRDDSVRSNTNGYGLGLAIVVETARSHRAGVGVEYRDGVSCFYMTVKRKRT